MGPCEKSCFASDPDVDCFVLDNNGYVIVSVNLEHTGKFFGEVRGHVMDRLVNEKVYQAVDITDYQAVCFERKSDGSPANILRTVTFYITRIKNLLSFFFL